MTLRHMSVSGSFYPTDADEIKKMIEHFNTILASHPDIIKRFASLHTNAIIVPHAGWVYSGFTANIAFRILSDSKPQTLVVIGPSHRVGFDGISIADTEFYQTPLGDIEIDRDLVQELMQHYALPYFPQAHHEHSTEVQMPFIKHYFPEIKVIELVYAYAEPSLLEPIIDYCLAKKDTAVVISTDLSHFYSVDRAKQLDAICLEAIQNENTDTLHQGCEACGMIGVEAMLSVARKKALQSVILDYRTSADASGDTSRVVGYASVAFC
ncbi:AmmeMemoRadiSam system protein B [Sulfuricurvum sp.]|uniref:AmmeMemoRadiSam system protein B n=1 Tax=Sulfuricurvum sp. TaxID=2025608 RepID=UPI00286DB7D8|nr:AmmeMemoRadiSam system protein B [Sulfuricurvum sp.]